MCVVVLFFWFIEVYMLVFIRCVLVIVLCGLWMMCRWLLVRVMNLVFGL